MDSKSSFMPKVGKPERGNDFKSLFEKKRLFTTPSTMSTSSSKSNLSELLSSSSSKSILTSSNSSSTLAQSSSQQVLNAGSSSASHLAKTTSSQRLITSSSSSSSQSHSQIATSKMNHAATIQRDLSEMKNSMNEINNLAVNNSSSNQLQMSELKNRLRRSVENLVDDDSTVGIVTFPDDGNEVMIPDDNLYLEKSDDSVRKFEQKSMINSSKTKISTNNFSSEQAISNSAQMKRVQVGDIEYKEASSLAARRNKTELDGLKTEAADAVFQEERSVKAGDYQRSDINNIEASRFKVQHEQFSAESRALKQAQQSQTKTSAGVFNQEQIQHKSQVSYNSSSMITQSAQYSTSSSTVSSNGTEVNNFEDLEKLNGMSQPLEVEQAIMKYSQHINMCVRQLNQGKTSKVLEDLNEIIRKAWAVPTFGHELGASLCNALKQNGGLDVIMRNCMDENKELQFSSAQLLEQCLTTENRAHVVEHGLDKVVNVACACTRNSQTDHSRIGTGILEHLFKHNEGTCSDVIKLGGLDAVLFECRKNDVETLRHCAGALANLSLYGGAENQEAMINRKVPMWLFPLAFHDDDNIKYYACLAIAVLVANKEIEAEVLKSGTLDLVEPFVTTHNPYEFAKSNLAHAHGQSKHWLQRLVPVLSSKREEARNLASFHFCMEAGIKKQQGKTEIFREIGAIEPLKQVASCPNAIASKFAAQALRLIGEAVPHKLSQQVPLWSVEDVGEWVKQIGFAEYEHNFYDSKVDGDLLLQLTDENLKIDLGMSNGIRRKRFERELQNLKRMADYSSRDPTNLNYYLSQIEPEFSIYTYTMLNAGVDRDSIRFLNDDQLQRECGIDNSIHRTKILNLFTGSPGKEGPTSELCPDKTLDVFVSYRRSNGSQLASLLKVHLQLRGFSVFIDVERLEAGKFDNNLLQSIKQAKHFLLVLTPRALERCLEDHDGKDWVHREIVAALNSNCNIIPIIDNFSWPEPEKLPEDMRSVCHFNGVRWIHDYQDACVDKLERFMRGELNTLNIRNRGFDNIPATPGTASSIRSNPPNYQRMHSNDSAKGIDVKEM